MKIGDTNPVRNTPSARRKAGVSGASGAFSELLDAAEATASEQATSSSNLAPISSLDSMLAMQSVSDEEGKRQRTIMQGHSMLDALENLRASLLIGAVPYDVLVRLDGQLARQREQTADPALHDLMDDIELRVAVEKAKLEVAQEEMRRRQEGGSGTIA